MQQNHFDNVLHPLLPPPIRFLARIQLRPSDILCHVQSGIERGDLGGAKNPPVDPSSPFVGGFLIISEG